MGLISYIRDIPNGPNNPSNDQPNMKLNTNAIDNFLAVDHVPFDVNNSGRHTVIKQQVQIANPAAIPPPDSFNQLFTKLVTPDTTGSQTDTQLFSLTSLGGVSQLTGDLALTDGYQWIGGVLVQWGRVLQTFSTGSTVGTVTFKDRAIGAIPFPTACFMVVANLTTLATVATPGNDIFIRSNTLSRTQFNWQVVLSSATIRGFFWIAIGN